MIQEKIECSILYDLGYIVRLEKKNGNNRAGVLSGWHSIKKTVNTHSRSFLCSVIDHLKKLKKRATCA